MHLTNEIVISRPPFGKGYAKDLVQLRSFIEHRLIANPNGTWKPTKEDPMWQAMCHFYSTLIRAGIESDRGYSTLLPLVPVIAAGGVIPAFDYPEDWRQTRNLGKFASEFVLTGIQNCVMCYGLPEPVYPEPIPREGVDSHLATTRPADEIRMRLKMGAKAWPILYLDDGQFFCGIYDGYALNQSAPKEMNELLKPKDLRIELCQFLLRDIHRDLPLRDVLTEDEERIDSKVLLAEWLPAKLTPESSVLILSAVGRGLWPPCFVEVVLEYLRKLASRDQPQTREIINNLDQGAKSLLKDDPSGILTTLSL